MHTPSREDTIQLIQALTRLVEYQFPGGQHLQEAVKLADGWLKQAKGTPLDALASGLRARGINAVVQPQIGTLRRAGDGDAPFDAVAVIIGNTTVMTIQAPAVERACEYWVVRTITGTTQRANDATGIIEQVCALYAHTVLHND